MNAVTSEETLQIVAPTVAAATPVLMTEAASLIQVIAAAARDPQVDIQKMERLWVMHERLRNRANEEAFNAAMNAAQAEMGPVSADATNDQTKSRYATYAQLDRALRPIYTKHGFALSFDSGDGAPEAHVRVLAYVSHSGGHTRTYRADMPADGKGAKGGDVMTKTHATGSAFSYGQRYLLKMIFNVAVGERDDDGNAAGGNIATVTEGIFKGLLDQLKSTKTDRAAADLWRTGSTVLAATQNRDAYTAFKEEVAAHRHALKAGGDK